MCYIAMAMPVGPWIAPTLVLLTFFIFRMIRVQVASPIVASIVSAGSIGGILATAFGFSFPTLYFLDPQLFKAWIDAPFFFIFFVGMLALCAGWFGLCVANLVEQKFIIDEQLAFPIGQLVHKMIIAQSHMKKSIELVCGFLGTVIFCVLQDGIFRFKGYIPKTVHLISAFSIGSLKIPTIMLNIWPMLWAVGFVTGRVIAWPLIIGACSKIFIVDVLNVAFFPAISSVEFVLAFCSGMVLAGALLGFFNVPRLLWGITKNIMNPRQQLFSSSSRIGSYKITNANIIELVFLLVFVIAFLTFFKFSPFAQLYLVLFAFICTYQITAIAGKIGLAQLGRFATFVMVPAMFLFDLNNIQIVLIATFVEICGGVATDILFGRKIAHLALIDRATIKRYQYLGLIVSSFSIGLILWLLVHHFQLGSTDLFAQRAQARQLLINATSFDYYVLGIGVIFGFFLKYIRCNPMLVLGGILMPYNISFGLIIGGLSATFFKQPEEWYPFWSGVFAAQSIWMLIKAIF